MMFPKVAKQMDKFILSLMNWQLPDSFEASYVDAPSFEDVLAQTWVDTEKTAVYTLTAPGTHTITMHSSIGELQSVVRVRPTVDPRAPLLMYHHGFNETPSTSSWSRLFSQPVPVHNVFIQAPFHTYWREPLHKGFASLQTLYQMFASSLRMMALIQETFEAAGSPFTVASGVSWGGVTSMLYEGLFQRTRAVVPMLSSPNIAQVMWDTAHMFNRPVAISQERLEGLLDFTPYFHRCEVSSVFPLVGEYDLFFRREHHWTEERPSLTTIPHSHISGLLKSNLLGDHILKILDQVQQEDDTNTQDSNSKETPQREYHRTRG